MQGDFTYFWPIAMIVFSSLGYQIVQKSTPDYINPLVSLIITYISAAFICCCVYPFFKGAGGIVSELRAANWASYALGLAIFGFDLGFLYAYRVGWEVSKLTLFTNSIVLILLIPLGMFVYQEKITLINALGLVMCLIGVVLISQH